MGMPTCSESSRCSLKLARGRGSARRSLSSECFSIESFFLHLWPAMSIQPRLKACCHDNMSLSHFYSCRFIENPANLMSNIQLCRLFVGDIALIWIDFNFNSELWYSGRLHQQICVIFNSEVWYTGYRVILEHFRICFIIKWEKQVQLPSKVRTPQFSWWIIECLSLFEVLAIIWIAQLHQD